jgi:flagellin-like hook-associated protein FlgL
MAINGVMIGNNVLGQSARKITDQLASLSTQLTTGKKSTTYSGMGVNEGFAIAARAQLSNIDGFTDTMTKINTTIGVANTALQSLVTIGNQAKAAAASTSQQLSNGGQSIAQQSAGAQFSSMLGILNTQSGDRYIFSGGALNTQSVASPSEIMDGIGNAAGLKQVMAERKSADLGASGLGRLVITQPTTTSASIAEDAAPSPFGFKLSTITSSLTGATITPPAGSPPALSVDLGATNPNPGDKLTLTFNLPDGTSEAITLTASTTTPLPKNCFAIGATSDVTATNLTAAITTAVGTLANTSLVAASAMQAAQNFFDSPPQRVGTTPTNAATTLVNGTAANTVSWYTGEVGATPARASATARIDQSITVQFGARANEQGIRNQLQALAAFSAVTVSVTDPNASGTVAALSARVTQQLSVQPGVQSIMDIQTDFSSAQVIMGDAKTRQGQTKTMLQSIVDQAENISPDEVATQLLALQNALSASYATTSRLSQMTLLKFL